MLSSLTSPLARAGALVVLIFSLTVFAVPAGASSSPVAVTTSAQWHLITTEGNMMGLTPSGNGGLYTYDNNGYFREIPASTLANVLGGPPLAVGSLPVVVNNSANPQGYWNAGIVPLANGSVIYDSGGDSTIWEKSATGVITPFTVIPEGVTPSGMVLSPNGLYVYVALQLPGAIVRFDLNGLDPVTVASGMYFPEQMAFDGSGNLFVADSENQIRNGNIYEIPAATLGSGSVASPGSGLVTVSTGSTTFGVNGLAFDGSGNLYFSDCSFSNQAMTIGEITAATLTGRSLPATLSNGGVIDFADGVSTPVLTACQQPLAIINNVLYAGTWDNSGNAGPIYAHYLGASATNVANLNVTQVGTLLQASWGGQPGAASYQCTLVYGYESPSTFTTTTTSTTCYFPGVAPNSGAGVEVTALGTTSVSSPVTGFPPPQHLTTLVCVRGSSIRRVRGYAPHCPAGYRAR